MLLIDSISGIFHSMFLIAQTSTITMLIITVSFFLILLILGVRKSYKLKAENEKLSKKRALESEENKKYEDFTQGHLYD